MPANLAQNLDQQASRSKSTTPRLSEVQQQNMRNSGEFQGLPPINTVTRQNSDASSQASLGSGLEAYLKDETFNDGPLLPPASNPYNTYDFSANRSGAQKVSNDPYSTDRAGPSQAPKKDPYSSYNPSTSQQAYPPQPPFADQGRPGSRPSSSHGRQQYPPSPPAMVDYSRGDYPNPASTGRQSYHQPSSSIDQSRMPPPLSADQFNYPRPTPPESGRSSRPLSQDMANLSLQQAPRHETPRPNRSSGTYQPLVADFIDMPDPTVPAHLIDPLPPPPSRPIDSEGRQSPGRQSPRSRPASGAVASPPAMVPPSEYEWETEIDGQRQNALQSNDPNVALSWAEKVYMYVSISMEEMRRERSVAGTDAPQPSSPSYERGLREDCTRIVEKFVKLGNPKAVLPLLSWEKLMG